MNLDLTPPLQEPVGILGFGVEGKSTLRFLLAQGIQRIAILDKAPLSDFQSPEGIQIEHFSGERYLDGLTYCKTVVRSAGVNPMQMPLFQFQMQGGRLTSQIELFFERTRSPRVVGVTGTLGKGSCVSMIAHCLGVLGVPHALGGNYGVAALDLLADQTENQVAILELSSFQLMTLPVSPPVAVVLKTTSEHLDWHRSVEEYRDAKANLVRWQRSGDCCVFYADSEGSSWIASQSGARKRTYGQGADQSVQVASDHLVWEGQRLNLADCKAQGQHQLENMAAALLALQALGCDGSACMQALKTYENLKYRLEFKGEKHGITFYNDSYATRPEATVAAASSMQKPFALILGGSEKHADFSELAARLSQLPNLRGVALIGYTAPRLRECLEKAKCAVPLEDHATLESAFAWCCQVAAPGGSVLLSPACASFGLFPNYKVRGERFDSLVQAY